MTTLGHERATSVLNYQFSFGREMGQLRELATPPRRTSTTRSACTSWSTPTSACRSWRYNNLRSLSAALRDGEFGPEASIGKYYWSNWHQQFTEVAMDVLGPDALLGTEWTTGPDDRTRRPSAERSSARGPRPSMPGPAKSRRTSSASACSDCPREPKTSHREPSADRSSRARPEPNPGSPVDFSTAGRHGCRRHQGGASRESATTPVSTDRRSSANPRGQLNPVSISAPTATSARSPSTTRDPRARP